MITANEVAVDTDEGRFVLLVLGEDGAGGVRLEIDIHDCVLSFYAQVREEIGPYAAEAENARQAVSRGVPLAEYLSDTPFDRPAVQASEPGLFDDGYEPGDPKSPGYHDRMVD